jgi:hypothetical protein
VTGAWNLPLTASRANVKYTWSCTSIQPYIFMMWRLIRDHITYFTLHINQDLVFIMANTMIIKVVRNWMEHGAVSSSPLCCHREVS